MQLLYASAPIPREALLAKTHEILALTKLHSFISWGNYQYLHDRWDGFK
jgi:hypothetical protein